MKLSSRVPSAAIAVAALLVMLAGCSGTPVIVVSGPLAAGGPIVQLTNGATVDFGFTMGTPTDITFTIGNTGDGNLILTSVPNWVEVVNGADGYYSLLTPPADPVIAPETTQEFILRLTPPGGIAITSDGQATITSNDPDLAAFALILTGFVS